VHVLDELANSLGEALALSSSASLSASGLVAAKFAGLIASENWRADKAQALFARGSASSASIKSDRKRELMR